MFRLFWCGCGKEVGVIMKLITFIVRGLWKVGENKRSLKDG